MARTKSADCFKAYSGDTNDNDTGNVELFDLIINNTINDTLVQTLSNNYLDKGFESLQYIGSSWTTGASTAKAKSAAQEYTQLLTKPFGNDFTMEQFRAHANEEQRAEHEVLPDEVERGVDVAGLVGHDDQLDAERDMA